MLKELMLGSASKRHTFGKSDVNHNPSIYHFCKSALARYLNTSPAPTNILPTKLLNIKD